MAATVKPGTVTKKKLTVAQAHDQWVKGELMRRRAKAMLDEATPVLKAHLEKSDRGSYKRVGLVRNAARRVLDQPKVKAFLGKKVDDYMKSTEPSTSLTLLEE